MAFYAPPWENNTEPNQGNVRQWLDNLYSKFQPLEQSRWNQSNIDTLFYAGSQTFVNRYFNFSPNSSNNQYYFNLIQQPVNMITGYQRQHRKSISYLPTEGSDPNTTDQYTRLITHCSQMSGINEVFSKACEQSAIAGMVLLQPYLDYTSDPAQGDLKLKLWEYNSFLIDPYWRNDINEAQFIWTQEYISKKEAEDRFPDKIQNIAPMSGTPQRYGSFYFLPENYNMARNDLMVLSYVWYKWKRKKSMLYDRERNLFYDYAGGNGQRDEILYNMPNMEEVTLEVPSWKLATVLNDQMLFQGENPLGFDTCPFVPVFWNYEPHNNYYDLRVRSLVRTARDAQFLLNYLVVTHNDKVAATINSGWKRKVGAVANEDNLKKTGQGWDIVVNEGYDMSDVEKIMPTALPASDFSLAEEMKNLIFSTTGIDLENWSGQQDKQTSSLTVLLKQAANLMVFQKYFDQWDHALKQLGDLLLKVVLNNWNASKVGLIIGEEPSPHFYSKIFAKYKVVVEEGLDTPTQKAYQAQQMLDINTTFGREVIPASMIIKDMALQGKTEILDFLKQQEQSASQQQQDMQMVQHAIEDAKLKELYSRATANIAMARERHGRSEADIGLFEERLSEITQNRAMATKAKMEALEKMVDVISKYGEIETMLKANQLESITNMQEAKEDEEKIDAKRTSEANKFLASILGQQQTRPMQPQEQMALQQ